jgi:hypothetical protein
MFVGEFLCLGWYYLLKWWNGYAESDFPAATYQPLNKGGARSTGDSAAAMAAAGEDAVAAQPKPPIWTFAVLSLCDLTASTISGVGFLYVSASTTQMLRGSSVLFTGIMSVR